MTNPNQLTPAEQAFALRMLPHLLAGMAATEAAGAVIDDDGRLFNALLSKRHTMSYGAAGDGGPLLVAGNNSSPLATQLSDAVYSRLRGAA